MLLAATSAFCARMRRRRAESRLMLVLRICDLGRHSSLRAKKVRISTGLATSRRIIVREMDCIEAKIDERMWRLRLRRESPDSPGRVLER